jgi:hypothetical protein
VVINSAVWGGSLLYYFIDARKWFKGPKMTVDVSEMTEAQQQVLENEGIEVVGAAGGDGNETPPDYKKSDGGVESA